MSTTETELPCIGTAHMYVFISAIITQRRSTAATSNKQRNTEWKCTHCGLMKIKREYFAVGDRDNSKIDENDTEFFYKKAIQTQ